jgi:hypothetical protein
MATTIGTVEIAAGAIATVITTAIAIEKGTTAAGVATTASKTVIATMVSTGGRKAVMASIAIRTGTATTAITSISKPNSKAIKMDFIPAQATLSVAKVTTHSVLTTTKTPIQVTTLRTAIEASFNRLIVRDFCRVTSRDINSTEGTTITTAAGPGNGVEQTLVLGSKKMPRPEKVAAFFL